MKCYPDVVDQYKHFKKWDEKIPGKVPQSLELFYPPVAGIDFPQPWCCGFFVLITNKKYFKSKTQSH